MESSDVSGCLLILTNFPADAHEMRKHKMLEPFVNCGGEVSWLGPTEALLVFRCTDKVAEAASIPTPLRIFSLVDYPGDAAGILEAGRIIFENAFKPRRDVSVANRFIGSSLGIRIKSDRATERPKSRVPSPPRQDAWDD